MMDTPYRIHTISEFHQFRELPSPEHPLISVIDYKDMQVHGDSMNMVLDFYSIALKRNFGARIRYGQQEYDFNEGIMFFIAPGQVYRVEVDENDPAEKSGYILLLHPDFLWNTPLAKSIRQYEYFDYAANEALFLSPKEEATVIQIIHNIRQEYESNIDSFSQSVIIAQLELLLTYSQRFYGRQFITRKISNHKVLQALEELMNESFEPAAIAAHGIPTVQEISAKLNLSPGYLSGLLKVLTGQSTQQHIQDKLIQKAKEKLSVTGLSVSEIAYEFGFEHPQSFSKFFKAKTKQSPLEFRRSFS